MNKIDQAALEHFDQLPDSAFVKITVVAAILGIHRATVYRKVEARELAPPVKLGVRSSGWTVGEVRRARPASATPLAAR